MLNIKPNRVLPEQSLRGTGFYRILQSLDSVRILTCNMCRLVDIHYLIAIAVNE